MGPERVRGIGGAEEPCPMSMAPEAIGARTLEEMDLGRIIVEEIVLGCIEAMPEESKLRCPDKATGEGAELAFPIMS